MKDSHATQRIGQAADSSLKSEEADATILLVEDEALTRTSMAARLKRLSFQMRLMALLPESSGAQGSRPWAGVCLLERVRDGQPDRDSTV